MHRPASTWANLAKGLADSSYLSHIVLRQPNYLFNYSNLGYQTYLVDQPGIEFMDKLYFDAHRLGELRSSIWPMRNPCCAMATRLSVDMNAVRRSDAPGTTRPGPQWIPCEEICQLLRYAGVSEKITTVGIYELDPAKDHGPGDHAQLAAQMIWCFLDGLRSRTNDLPWLDRKRFTRFRIPVRGHDQELVFYKSSVSDSWWMDMPYRPSRRPGSSGITLVPCLYRLPDGVPRRGARPLVEDLPEAGLRVRPLVWIPAPGSLRKFGGIGFCYIGAGFGRGACSPPSGRCRN
jgi:formiminoglutamase